jgi:hypothetical protein
MVETCLNDARKLYSKKSFEVVHGGRKVARPIKIQIDQRKF